MNFSSAASSEVGNHRGATAPDVVGSGTIDSTRSATYVEIKTQLTETRGILVNVIEGLVRRGTTIETIRQLSHELTTETGNLPGVARSRNYSCFRHSMIVCGELCLMLWHLLRAFFVMAWQILTCNCICIDIFTFFVSNQVFTHPSHTPFSPSSP
jgi:hypothetical protein